MNKHTPGPWKVVADEQYDRFAEADRIVGYDIKSADGEIVGSEGISGDSEINLANAHLIAAAPDLLDALERILEQPLTGNPSHKRLIEHWEYERSLGNGYAKDQLFALSAIAKAKGE